MTLTRSATFTFRPIGCNSGQLRYSNPQVKNALSLQSALELQGFFPRLQALQSLHFFAPGPVFCSGGDLTDSRKMAAAKGREQDRLRGQTLKDHQKIGEILQAFSRLAPFKTAWVQGDCFGGGLELLSAFEEVIAAPEALFGFWQSRLGLTPGWGGFGRWETRMAPSVLRSLLQTSRTFGAEEALRLGLITEIRSGAQIAAVFGVSETKISAASEASHDEAIGFNPEARTSLANAPQQIPRASIRDLSGRNEAKTFRGLWGGPGHLQALTASQVNLSSQTPEAQRRSRQRQEKSATKNRRAGRRS